jgi:hypothetical protein
MSYNYQSNSVITNSVIRTPGYKEQNEYSWLVSVTLGMLFSEQNPIITNKIKFK